MSKESLKAAFLFVVVKSVSNMKLSDCGYQQLKARAELGTLIMFLMCASHPKGVSTP